MSPPRRWLRAGWKWLSLDRGGIAGPISAYRIQSTRWSAARSASSIPGCRRVRALPIIWDKLIRLESALRDCIAAGIRDEMETARDRSKGKLEWKLDLLGSRPGGELASNSPLLATLRADDEAVDNQSRLERASTDANIPLSLGIDAIAIGAGGNGGGAHSLQEWYESDGREIGLQRVLLTVLGASGIVGEKS